MPTLPWTKTASKLLYILLVYSLKHFWMDYQRCRNIKSMATEQTNLGPACCRPTIDLQATQATHGRIPPRISRVSSSVPDTWWVRWTLLDMQLLDFWWCGQLSFFPKVIWKGTRCDWISSLSLSLDSNLLSKLCIFWPPRIMSSLASHLLKVAKTLQDPSKATRLLRPLKLRLVVQWYTPITDPQTRTFSTTFFPYQNLPKLLLWTLFLNSVRTPEPFKLSETWEIFVIYIQNLQTYQISQYPRNPGSSCQRSGVSGHPPGTFWAKTPKMYRWYRAHIPHSRSLRLLCQLTSGMDLL